MTRTRDELEFLPAALEVLETPPRPAARVLAFTIAVFVVLALAWSILGFLDTVAIAQGQLVPNERVKLVQPIENGVIRAIHVRDGQKVEAGQVLVELDMTDASTNLEALKTDLLKAQLDAATAAAFLAPNPSESLSLPDGASGLMVEAARLQMLGEVEKLKASLSALDAEIDELDSSIISYETQYFTATSKLPLIEERLSGLEVLDQKQLARKPDLLAVRQQQLEARSDIATATAGIDQAKARLDARHSRRAEIKATAEADALQRRADALRRIAAFDQQIRKEERRQADRLLRAPIAGTVVGLSVYTIGGVTTTKDVLLRIVPEGSFLEAEVLVQNKDIGFVEIGQRVELKLETFPFTRYGLIEGVVTEIWRDAIQDEKLGLVYKAEIALKQDRILVGSKWVLLGPGMSVQAEISTGERRAIDYFLSPLLRYQDEALRER